MLRLFKQFQPIPTAFAMSHTASIQRAGLCNQVQLGAQALQAPVTGSHRTPAEAGLLCEHSCLTAEMSWELELQRTCSCAHTGCNECRQASLA